MNYKEEKYLNYVNERINELLENNADKNYITDLLDDIIYRLSNDLSPELIEFKKILLTNEKGYKCPWSLHKIIKL